MPEFNCKVKACKSIWVKRIIKSEKLCHFAKIFGLPLSIQEMCKFNFDMKYLKDYIVLPSTNKSLIVGLILQMFQLI